MSSTVEAMRAQAEEFRDRYTAVREMIGRVIVGHDDIVHGVLTAMLCGGHCLLEGVPGLGKTMVIEAVAPAATAGGKAVEKIKPDAKLRTKSQSAAEAAIYPPTTPKALPRVPSITVRRSISLSRSAIPPPRGP